MENENNLSGNIENTDTEPAETIKEDLTDRIKEKTEALMNVSETVKTNKEENGKIIMIKILNKKFLL